MDTKLKNLNKRVAQIILIPVCALCFAALIHCLMQSIIALDRSDFSERILQGGTYEESGEMKHEMENLFNELSSRCENSVYEGWYYEDEAYIIESVETDDGTFNYAGQVQNVPKTPQDMWELFEENLNETLGYMELDGRGEQMGFSFRIKDYRYDSAAYQQLGESGFAATISGTPDSLQFIGLNGASSSLSQRVEHWAKQMYWNIKEIDSTIEQSDVYYFVGLREEYVAEQSEAFVQVHQTLTHYLLGAAICGAAMLVVMILTIVITGRKNEQGAVVLGGIDRWPTELFLAAMVSLLFFGVFMMSECINYGYWWNGEYYWYETGFTVHYSLCMAGICAVSLAAMTLFFCLVRKIKAKQFFATFLIFRLFSWLFQGLKEVYYGGSAMRKLVLLIIGACLLCATVVAMPLMAGILIVLGAKCVKQYEAIRQGVAEIRSGNAGYRIPIEGNPKGEFQQLAAEINDISDGLELAVRQELKNQRMKSELISNVSHDLKTPMTSIISYIDLMKKEGLESENAPRYLEILDEKSMRLKKLCEDLFEAAKASSGDMPVHLTKVEMSSLISQGLGEYQDRFAQKGFQVIFNAAQEKYYVMADGQLLWRVIENLFGNLLKYAMENTRVYLDLRQEMDDEGTVYAAFDVKNISKYPLNIPADELMERFKRGDDSRSTEGSGLGLSIAKDLTSLQNGRFTLTVDGDLFKATVMFRLLNE